MARQGTVARTLSRGLVLAALLAGLFAMHGLTHSATGCGSATNAPTPMMTAEHGMHAMPVASGAGSTGPVFTMLMPHSAGTDCVATVPRGQAGAPVLALVAIVLIAAVSPLGATIRRRAGDWLRGPPVAGVRLLHLVCVSRT